jgi:hypothetical protein
MRRLLPEQPERRPVRCFQPFDGPRGYRRFLQSRYREACSCLCRCGTASLAITLASPGPGVGNISASALEPRYPPKAMRRAEAAINVELRVSGPLFSADEGPVFEATTTLDIRGKSTYPTERAGESYEITIKSDPSHRSQITLKDIHARSKYNVPLYRPYRGTQIPIYECPPGLATLECRRHDKVCSSWVRVDPRLTTNMLMLLGQSWQLYLCIHESKADR